MPIGAIIAKLFVVIILTIQTSISLTKGVCSKSDSEHTTFLIFQKSLVLF